MRVLVACEFSGVVRNAFLARGHDAYSCDILPTVSEPKSRHYWKDVTPLLREPWDLVIAHPPCTYLTNTGVCWLEGNPERRMKMLAACEFFVICLNANAPRVCVENPIMHGYARERIECDYSQIVQPWMFGGGESKSTCLWLRGLPPLIGSVRDKPLRVVGTRSAGRAGNLGPSYTRGLLRSITHLGLAAAMADQWSSL